MQSPDWQGNLEGMGIETAADKVHRILWRREPQRRLGHAMPRTELFGQVQRHAARSRRRRRRGQLVPHLSASPHDTVDVALLAPSVIIERQQAVGPNMQGCELALNWRAHLTVFHPALLAAGKQPQLARLHRLATPPRQSGSLVSSGYAVKPLNKVVQEIVRIPHCPKIDPNFETRKKKALSIAAKCLFFLVGGAGFEPATPAV